MLKNQGKANAWLDESMKTKNYIILMYFYLLFICVCVIYKVLQEKKCFYCNFRVKFKSS